MTEVFERFKWQEQNLALQQKSPPLHNSPFPANTAAGENALQRRRDYEGNRCKRTIISTLQEQTAGLRNPEPRWSY